MVMEFGFRGLTVELPTVFWWNFLFKCEYVDPRLIHAPCGLWMHVSPYVILVLKDETDNTRNPVTDNRKYRTNTIL